MSDKNGSIIKSLPIEVINQIAAGEIIERPAAVVKELIENSIDAHATQIEIELIAGGKRFIKVIDNGVGIIKSDLLVAIKTHTTSKISEISDLLTIKTLGFRGEGLASISNVSQFNLRSKVHGNDVCGWEISRSKDEFILKPTAHPLGTTVEVRNLFFNIPARAKFLLSDRYEYLKCEEVVKRIAISHPKIKFFFKHNDRQIYKLHPVSFNRDFTKRIQQICNKDFINYGVEINFTQNELNLLGYITLPNFSRAQNDMQYFYVNGRYVRDKIISLALRNVYKDLIPKNRYPGAILFLEIDPQEIDINVHPTKSEIRFSDNRAIYSFIFSALNKGLLTSSKIQPNIKPSSLDSNERELPRSILNVNTTKSKPYAENRMNENIVQGELHNLYSSSAQVKFAEQKTYREVNPSKIDFHHNYGEKISVITANNRYLGEPLAQLHDKYILAQNEYGLVVLDTHGACERIIYEKLKKSFANANIEAQPLLIPITLSLTLSDIDLCVENLVQFEKLGFSISPIDENSIIIRKIPSILINSNVKQLVIDVIADLKKYQISEKIVENINKILANMACHNSFRGKVKLTLDEMRSILRKIEKSPKNLSCNHGRPIWKQISVNEFNKFFLKGR